jgi:hypothetical protein
MEKGNETDEKLIKVHKLQPSFLLNPDEASSLKFLLAHKVSSNAFLLLRRTKTNTVTTSHSRQSLKQIFVISVLENL